MLDSNRQKEHTFFLSLSLFLHIYIYICTRVDSLYEISFALMVFCATCAHTFEKLAHAWGGVYGKNAEKNNIIVQCSFRVFFLKKWIQK